MRFGILKTQVINKINMNSFNKLEKAMTGTQCLGATTRLSFVKKWRLMQTKKKERNNNNDNKNKKKLSLLWEVLIMRSLLRIQLTHQFQLT